MHYCVKSKKSLTCKHQHRFPQLLQGLALDYSPGPEISLGLGGQHQPSSSPPSLLQIHLSPQATNHSAFQSLPLLQPVCSQHNGSGQNSARADGWVTGGAWLSTTHPSHKEWCGAVAFPLFHARVYRPQATLGTIVSDHLVPEMPGVFIIDCDPHLNPPRTPGQKSWRAPSVSSTN